MSRTLEDVQYDLAAVDMCRCGHTRAQHQHRTYKDAHYQIGIGHGACAEQGCECGRFTFKEFTDRKKFDELCTELTTLLKGQQ